MSSVIKSLSKMEQVVAARRNVEWDGWDVLVYRQNGAGFLKKDGAFRNGRWYVVQRIKPTRQGWEVPYSWVR